MVMTVHVLLVAAAVAQVAGAQTASEPRGRSIAAAVPIVAADPAGDARTFRLEQPFDPELVHRASKDYYRNHKSAHARGLLRAEAMALGRSCFTWSDACRQLATNPEVLRQARISLGHDEPLFIKTLQIIDKQPGACQRIHTDLDMFTPECSGPNSVAVWVLTKTTPAPLPEPSVYAVEGSHGLNMTAMAFLSSLACPISPLGWTTCETLDAQPWRCHAEQVVAEAARQFPESGIRAARGPLRVGEGIAWRGHGWHWTRDDRWGRQSVLVQMGTERCVRSQRVVEGPFDGRWQGPEWYPWMPMPDANRTRGEQPIHKPHPLDSAFLGSNAPFPTAPEACGSAQKSDDQARAHVSSTHVSDGSVHVVAPGAIDAESSAGKGGVTLRSVHLDSLSATRTHWRAGAAAAASPATHESDVLCVVLNGSVDYAYASMPKCGMYTVVTALPSYVSFFPRGIYFATAPSLQNNGTELCLHLNPAGSGARAPPPLDLKLAKEAAAAADALLRRDVTASGEAPVARHKSTKTSLFTQAYKKPGSAYAWLSAHVLSFGDHVYTSERASEYENLVVPISGGITLVPRVGPPLRVQAGGFAHVGPHTPISWSTNHTTGPVDVLFVEMLSKQRKRK